MEEEQKKSWFADKKDKFLDFCKRHPDACLTVLGGLATLAGGALKLMAYKNEYEDNVYMIQDDKVYRVPAKEMQSKKIDAKKV